ncbi:MAG TPA: hypothetical protein VGD59_15760 [Acidisarcina sp.]
MPDVCQARTAIPFEWILAAQSLADDLPIVSSDQKLDCFEVRRLG